MKRSMCLVMCVLVCVLGTQVSAYTIKGVSIIQGTGVQAEFKVNDPVTGTATMTWKNGASGQLLTDDFSYITFDTVSVSATFTGLEDLSAGGVAKGSFDTGVWSIDLGVSGDLGTVNISGHLESNYNYLEVEATDPGTYAQKIDGSALAVVDSATFELSFFRDRWGITDPVFDLEWANPTNQAALYSSLLFAEGDTLVENYGSDFNCDNVTVTLLADTAGVIPEPATLALLGLGSLLALKRRRA